MVDSGYTTAVIGPGAIGLVVISALSAAERAPLVAARSSFERVVHHDGDTERLHDVSVLTSPDEVEAPVDVVFLATKIPQTAGAAAWIEALCGPDSVLAALQNGIDHRARLSRYVAEESVVPVVVNLPAERIEPGTVHADTRKSSLVVPDSEAGRRVAACLDGSFLPVRVVEDFVTASWTKLVINASLGILGVLTGAPNGVIVEPEANWLIRALIDEAAEVGRAEGADLPHDIADRIVNRVLNGAPGHRSSIAVDRAAGLPTEWESRNKVVVDLAEQHGIAVPLNRAGTALISLGEPDRHAP